MNLFTFLITLFVRKHGLNAELCMRELFVKDGNVVVINAIYLNPGHSSSKSNSRLFSHYAREYFCYWIKE